MLGDDGKPRKRQILVGFRDSRTVFGYSDTDGDELPPVQLPGWDIDTALAALGIDRVAFDMVNGNVQGFSFEDDNGRHVALNPTAVYPAKTLLHELAHLMLGHCTSGDDTHRGVAEFEAEATAYLVAKELELIAWDPAESRAYIQAWLGGTEVDRGQHQPRVRGRQQDPDRGRVRIDRRGGRGVKQEVRTARTARSRFEAVVPAAILANSGCSGGAGSTTPTRRRSSGSTRVSWCSSSSSLSPGSGVRAGGG